MKHRHFSLEPTVGLQEAVVQGIKAKKSCKINNKSKVINWFVGQIMINLVIKLDFKISMQCLLSH